MGTWGGWEGGERDGDGWGHGVDGRERRMVWLRMVTKGEIT